MNQTNFADRWAAQAHVTRVAVSAAIAFAVMLVLYLVLTTFPSLVQAHAALYRVFETRGQALEMIARGALSFCIGMQLLIAYACARANRQRTTEGTERNASATYPAAGLFILWTFGGLIAFASFSPDYFTVKGPNSWSIVGMLAATQAFGFFGICLPLMYKDETERNRVMCFAVGKWVLCLAYLGLSPSKMTFTLVVGTFLLDFLLHPIGVMPKGNLDAPEAGTGPGSDPEVQPDLASGLGV